MKSLGEVCDFVRGPFGGALKKSCFVESGFAVYEQKHAIHGDFNSFRYFIDIDKFEDMSRFEVAPGDVLMSCSGTIGRTKVVPKGAPKGIINQALLNLKPKEGLTPFFLKKWMESVGFVVQIEERSSGAALQNVASVKILKTIEIPLPDIEEQQEIVALLDSAFEKIDKAKANVERNLKNAEELFQSALDEVFSNPGEDWEVKPLGEVCTKIGSGATPKGGEKSYKESGISLIRSMNVYDNLFVRKGLAFIDEEQASKLDNVSICEQDVLLNITGASIARCAIVPKEVLPARVNQHVSILRPSEIVDSKFLCLQLIAPSVKSKLLSFGEFAATRQALTKGFLTGFKIKIPGLNEQHEIVTRLEALSGHRDKVVAKCNQELHELEELRQSILEQAFEGKLTQSPAS